MNNIFTIGHSSHSIEKFLNLLETHAVQVVADVRSRPHSSRFPQYSQAELKRHLKDHGIRYVFLGAELGARRVEPEAYQGQVASYELIARLPAFHKGLERLEEGAAKFRVALMCAERDPVDCHRMVLVCRNLPPEMRDGVGHILDSGELEKQADTEKRLIRKTGLMSDQEELFSVVDDGDSVLDRAYRLRGTEIAWQENL